MDSSTPEKRTTSGGFKPQRVWALRKKFSSVKVRDFLDLDSTDLHIV